MSDADLFEAKCNVSRETIERLSVFANLLKKWNPAINLVSPQTLSQIWSRHFLDSAQLFDASVQNAASWVDLGSGGGFPGLVIAALAADTAPEMSLTLVESDKRKAAFLLTAAREMGVSVKVLTERAEAIAPLSAQVVSARALAPLGQLLALAERHLAAEGVALFPKGGRWREEVALAQQTWSFSCDPQPSVTDPQAVVLRIKGLERA